MLLAGGSGLYLYQSKHRAQMLDREIGRTIKQTETTRERIGMLKAEWALLNEPERLSELSKNHLGLRTLAPTQFVSLTDMGVRLPAAVVPGTTYLPPGFGTEEPAPPPAASAQVTPTPTPTPLPARPAAPVRTASATAAVPAMVQADAHPATPPRPTAPRPAPAAASAPPARPAGPPVWPSVGASVVPVAATPARPQTGATAPGTIGEAVLRAMQANASAPYSPAAAPAAAPSASSLLGGTRAALPPPVPYAAR